SARRARLANPWTAAWLAGSSRASSRHAAVQPRAAVGGGGADAVQRLTDSGSLAQSSAAGLRATSGSRVASASVGSTGAARVRRRAAVRAAAAHLAGVASQLAVGQQAGSAVAAVAARPWGTRGAHAKAVGKRAIKSAGSPQAPCPIAALIAELAGLIRRDATR